MVSRMVRLMAIQRSKGSPKEYCWARQLDVALHVLYALAFLFVYVLGGPQAGHQKNARILGVRVRMDRHERAPRRHLQCGIFPWHCH
jgi:hypothetical protein